MASLTHPPHPHPSSVSPSIVDSSPLTSHSFEENGEMIHDDPIVISRDAFSALMIKNDSVPPMNS